MSNRIEEIEKEIERLQIIVDEKEKQYWNIAQSNTLSAEEGYKKYLQKLEPENSKISALNREKRLLMIPAFFKLSNYGHVMPLQEFIDCVESGGFIDYDGFGKYVKDNKESNINIYPSDVKNNSIRKDFDTIIWFNR